MQLSSLGEIFFGVSSKQNQIDHNGQSDQKRNHREPIRSKSKTSSCLRRGKTPVTHVTIGYDFASDWLKGWREFSRPIMKRSSVEPHRLHNCFDTNNLYLLSNSEVLAFLALSAPFSLAFLLFQQQRIPFKFRSLGVDIVGGCGNLEVVVCANFKLHCTFVSSSSSRKFAA